MERVAQERIANLIEGETLVSDRRENGVAQIELCQAFSAVS
jgi:hypothetical protein